ncbi:MAG: hypothetical protein PHR30_13655 [Gallionellaceae bacterium]|nr:hypothetical protein [Gallionellaceae bacterium]
MSHRGNMPEWLYRSLPFLYIASGLLVMFSLGNAVAIFSGLMLVSAGVIVWRARVRYRRSRRVVRSRPMPAPPPAAAAPGGGLVSLVWRKEYESGHPFIDAQHRGLFESGNALLNSILEKQAKLDVELMLDELIEQVEKHFRDEEAMLARVQRPVDQEHEEYHRQLLVRARSLSESFHQDEMAVGELFEFIANDVVAQHIVMEGRTLLKPAHD